MHNHSLTQTIHVPASEGAACLFKKGQCLKLIDIEGKQVADLMAWNEHDFSEYFSPAHTITHNWSIALKPENQLATNRRNPIFKIIEDTVGYHDIVVPCCDTETYITRYNIHDHRSCKSNIIEAIEKLELKNSPPISGELAWNVFMKNEIDANHKMIYQEPEHPAGSYIVLEALMDCLVAVSACPQDQTPTNGWNCSPLLLEIWQPNII